MKVLGIVVEYNPFHNGHLHHLKEAKTLINPDYTIAVMSGNFVQRGEPAILDKFSRAEIAVNMGVDVVLELPFVYCIQDASGFATGAIGVLERTNVVTDIVFGSESSNLEVLDKISNILYEQPKNFKKLLNKNLKKGLSFPNARKFALVEHLESSNYEHNVLDILEQSNDILGLEYLNALKLYNSKIVPHTIQRIKAEYNQKEFTGEISSATAIRNLIEKKEMNKVKQGVPPFSYEVLLREIEKGKAPIIFEDMRDIVLAKLRMMKREEFIQIDGVKEGLETRYSKFSKTSSNLTELVNNVKTKRFTLTRVKRTLLKILFDLKEKDVKLYNNYGPQYLRVLAFTKKGQELLGKIKDLSTYPIITTPSRYRKIYNRLNDKLLSSKKKYESIPEIYLNQIEYDFLASNIYTLLYKNTNLSSYEPDKKNRVIIL
ncbi:MULTISPECIES: nucleotidyltransferase [Petrotoga]|uniref:tRNA(Met) cytidine acetate ligase n=2 Tax=Petrotoga sibirica TaxID=156202 RepID=A0A4R8EZC1_9BACT|nr:MULTISPECIES: nucleotidyltransferase [Petrotoga]POZ89504.1 hypothetical protein AA80_00115 [Petrotoga sibirica DSM 13575]POZ91846.1 hypothetical protein AD60_00115 [Petrotoga sp. SL27]TDX16195.1 putative nucleotidyltransferase [Petrotoga sibirica]